ncbi:MAG TPA: glycosyltransferase [Candidatus Paceibacterota bacterium]|nr:glycosyltransferase [Candidatus Paceibacterota bacterium]
MKFSLVTPVYNMEAYIAETIRSVIAQEGDFDLEYTLVNDGSTDRSESIILGIKKELETGTLRSGARNFKLSYVKQQNQGMYAAINNGFSAADGDVLSWLGGDDKYAPGGLQAIANWFSSHPESNWAKGLCGFIDEHGKVIREGIYKTYYRDWLQKGIYGRETYFVEQESTFWRAQLWRKVAPIPVHLRSAGDYWLGIQFAKHASLDSIHERTTYFRIRPGQISSQNAKYRGEQQSIMPKRSLTAYKVRLFSILSNKIPSLSPVWHVLYKCMFPTRILPPETK